MRNRTPTRNEYRVSRRFESHGRAVRWAAMTAGKVVVCLLAFGVYRVFTRGYGWWGMLTYAGIALTTWLVSFTVAYLYLALSGGVLSREERRRKNPLG